MSKPRAVPRPRPITLVVLGTLAAAGLAAACRAGREDRDGKPAAVPAPSPPDPTPASAPRIRPLQRTPRRIAALALTLGAAVLLFAGAAWSGQRPHAEQRSAAAEERAQAETSRLVLLGRLQLAGIAARRAGPPRAAIAVRAAAPGPDEQDLALASYMTAVGTDSVETTVTQSGSRLAEQVLADERIVLNAAGRADVASGRVDARVLALLLYLAEAHGQVTVSILVTGHSRFVAQTAADKKRQRPRVVSAHVSGRAVDISALGGIPIVGNQQPDGIADRAIRGILSLPPSLQPAQVISLLDLSGPSFRLPDHADHLHVGY